MSSAYTLQNRVLGQHLKVDISREYFDSLKDSKDLFSMIFIIEESFNILMENFFALESEAQAVIIRDMIHQHHSYEHFNSVRANLTRHTINFLATFTTYMSVIKKAKFPGASTRDATEPIISVLEKNDDCRLLEVVRNISQHRDLPVSGLTLGSSWKAADGSTWSPNRNEAHRSQYTVDFYLNTDKIISDRKSKIDRETLYSLNKIGLPMLIRKNVEALGLAQLDFRERISPALKAAQARTLDAIDMYKSHSGEKPSNLHAVSTVEGDPDVLIIDDHFKYIADLQAKNSSFANLSKRVASSYVND